MKKLTLTLFAMLLLVAQPILAQDPLAFTFTRSGNGVSVTVSGAEDVTATIAATSASNAWNTGGAMASRTDVLCQNTNTSATTADSPIKYTLTIEGLNSEYNTVAFTHIAVNSAGNLQPSNDQDIRHCNLTLKANGNVIGEKSNENIWIPAGKTEKNIIFENNIVAAENNTLTLELTLYKGTSNNGCFYGLTKVTLSNTTAPTPTPNPDDSDAKVYYISWKNTKSDYITEEPDHRMTIQSQDVTKAQFWEFIPTGKENCYYIKNTATKRYIGSCNLEPGSNSKISTKETPVEYYVGKTTATTGENANCWFFSSTDCADYSDESKGPRALNKDGASSYIITWAAKPANTGSYWKLIETPDLYEIRPFEGSSAIGNIGTSYNIECSNGKNLTITNGNLALATPDYFDENQEWYFVGTGNSTGWQIASASELAIVVGIADGNIVAGEGLSTKWKVNKADVNGYFYFTNENTTLEIEGESLFRFTRLRSAYTRSLKIYNNPCGAVANNFVKTAKIHGQGAIDNIIYESNNKPGTWHIMYAMDKGEVIKNEKFNIDITLAENAANDLTAIAHFDWNSDGIFETAVPLTLNGTAGTAEVTVPDLATETQTRMRLRVNSNGLDLAEDEVYGFIYDFHIKVVTTQENRTATVATNASDRGTAALSEVADSYAYGTTLTAKAIPAGNAQFVCWREEGVVVSTDAEYTFTVDRNVKLVAYFTPNTQNGDDNITDINNINSTEEVVFTIQDNTITAVGECNITGMTLYTVDAAVVTKSDSNTISTAGVTGGVYIVCAKTENGYKNCKIYLNK